MNITPLFVSPLMQVQLDFDLEKLTEFAFEMWNKDKNGAQLTNRGGWHSGDISKETHEEFIRLKKEISQYVQKYHLEVFRGMVFKGNIIQHFGNIWVNINKKYHYNEWHVHPYSTISGAYYIKHDGSKEQGDIMFKNPFGSYLETSHWPQGLIESPNEVTSGFINIKPSSNALFIFPSWIEHKVENNLKDNTRISLSFNTQPILENNNG